ncbi:hypothetical protein ACSSVZ_004071 [Amorphus sp. MBR-141]
MSERGAGDYFVGNLPRPPERFPTGCTDYARRLPSRREAEQTPE